MIAEISGAYNAFVAVCDSYELYKQFPGTVDCLRKTEEIARWSEGFDSVRRELRDLVLEGEIVSDNDGFFSAIRRILFAHKASKRIPAFNSLVTSTSAVELHRSLGMAVPEESESRQHVLIDILDTIQADRNRCVPVGIIIGSGRPVDGLLQMICEDSGPIMNFWGPSWAGIDVITENLCNHPRTKETFGNVYFMDVKKNPSEIFISEVRGLLGYDGKVEGLGTLATGYHRKLLIFFDFPPEWVRFIEKIAFPNTSWKLLVVSRTKLSGFNAYGLDHAYDENGKKQRHLHNLNENHVDFDDIENKRHLGTTCTSWMSKKHPSKIFISEVRGLLGYDGKVEGLGTLATGYHLKLLIFFDFPPEWVRFIEKIAFPNTSWKLLVVSRTKLSGFNAYGLDHAYDENGKKHRHLHYLNENHVDFDDIENKVGKFSGLRHIDTAVDGSRRLSDFLAPRSLR